MLIWKYIFKREFFLLYKLDSSNSPPLLGRYFEFTRFMRTFVLPKKKVMNLHIRFRDNLKLTVYGVLFIALLS